MKRVMMNMINLHVPKLSGRSQAMLVPFAMVALWITIGACLGLAQQSVRPTFASAVAASQSLFQAVQSNNEQAIANILGGPTDLTSSGEPGQDKVDRELFAQKYQEMHRLSGEPDGSVILYIGAENWPFPITLVKENGAWHFDSEAGQKEVLFRRIGENELIAIANCREFVAAEKRYHSESNTSDLTDTSPASLAAMAASGAKSGAPVLFHGYYFRLSSMDPAKGKTPGGFALIAYPAEYQSSGVMTFIVTNNGVVYERDLGANTSALASAMAVFHKDATWRQAD
jgi:Protein of unknown function (DUF2950)